MSLTLDGGYLSITGGRVLGPLRFGTDVMLPASVATDALISLAGNGDSSTTIQSLRYSVNAGGPVLHFVKTRGPLATDFGPPIAGDPLGTVRFIGANTASNQISSQISAIALETFTTSARGSVIAFSVTGIGNNTLVEVGRFNSSLGLQMYGTNTVIDANRIYLSRSYTRTTTPSAAPAGLGPIWISNPISGIARPFWANGTVWADAISIAA